MRFEHRSFRLPKDTREPDAYEDAHAVAPELGLAAVADGAASTLFSGSWARILTASVAQSPPLLDDGDSFHPWLADCRAAWSKSFDPQTLSWHQKPKLPAGAAATLLWVQIRMLAEPDDSGAPYEIEASAIGDCVLFHEQGGRITRAFPIEDSSQFAERPAAISSAPAQDDDTLAFDTLHNMARPGDLLALCTDALAQWALTRLEQGEAVSFADCWDQSEEAWQAQILKLREEGAIRFDDTTLLLLRLSPPPEDPEKQRDWQRDLKGTVATVQGAIEEVASAVGRAADKLKEAPALDWLKDKK